MKPKKGIASPEVLLIIFLSMLMIGAVMAVGAIVLEVKAHTKEKQEHKEKFQHKVGDIVQFKLDDRKGIIVEHLKNSCTVNGNGQHYFKIGDYQYKIGIKLLGEYRTLMVGHHELVPRNGVIDLRDDLERIHFEE